MTTDVTMNPVYHALYVAFTGNKAAWDAVRPESFDATDLSGLTSEQQDRYDRYLEALDELNGYRTRHGMGRFSVQG
jgi:hypothetical protein